jgi:hypothetical protein
LYRPAIFYTQKNGKVLSIEKDVVYYRNGRLLNRKHTEKKIYRFLIDDCSYIMSDYGQKYDYLTSKNITFRYDNDNFMHGKETTFRYMDKKRLIEITYDGKVIYLNIGLSSFIIPFALCILSLIWIIWAFVKYLKKPDTKQKLKEDEEEYFLEDYKISKVNNRYLLYYVSLLDSKSIKIIEITEEEFLSAKNGKMKLEDFRSVYNLW